MAKLQDFKIILFCRVFKRFSVFWNRFCKPSVVGSNPTAGSLFYRVVKIFLALSDKITDTASNEKQRHKVSDNGKPQPDQNLERQNLQRGQWRTA
jgi:hypothetical protein